jgi:hypothetical protein
MIRLHCTKKLLAKLPLGEDGRLKSRRDWPLRADADDESPLRGWHANLILLQRRQCVLFVHDATRFPVFVPALKKDHFADLDWFFQDSFMNTLLKLGANHATWTPLKRCWHRWYATTTATARCRARSIRWRRS